MKAILCTKYGSPEVLQQVEIPRPEPKENEVLIKIRATTVTVADSRIRGFRVPMAVWVPARLFLGITKPKKAILGLELSGVIEKVGKNVKRFKKGEAVLAATLFKFGAYAEYINLSANGAIVLKPANLSFEEAAAIPVGARTALHFLKKGNIQKGQKILVYGASGSVGSYAVQLAKEMGAEVTGVCSSTNLSMVKSLGADKVMDYTHPDFTKNLEQYDAIFLAIDKLPFSVCNKHLKEGGVYFNVVSSMKSPAMAWVSLTSKKRFVIGDNPSGSSEELGYLAKLAAEGKLVALIDKVYSFDQIVAAHRYVDKGHKKGNVVIKVIE